MASSPNKVVFRPRAVDPTRKMPIRIFRTKVQSPGKIAASILPPSGMEKGEEKVKDLKKIKILMYKTIWRNWLFVNSQESGSIPVDFSGFCLKYFIARKKNFGSSTKNNFWRRKRETIKFLKVKKIQNFPLFVNFRMTFIFNCLSLKILSIFASF